MNTLGNIVAGVVIGYTLVLFWKFLFWAIRAFRVYVIRNTL